MFLAALAAAAALSACSSAAENGSDGVEAVETASDASPIGQWGDPFSPSEANVEIGSDGRYRAGAGCTTSGTWEEQDGRLLLTPEITTGPACFPDVDFPIVEIVSGEMRGEALIVYTETGDSLELVRFE
jgi:hypothetical protein